MISDVGRPPILKEVGDSRTPYKSNYFYIFVVFCIFALEVLFSGSRIADWDLSSVFVAMAQGRMPELAPDRQFQLEGLLPNSIGTGYAAIGLRGGSLLMATWLTGLFSFLAVCAYYVYKGRVGLSAV